MTEDTIKTISVLVGVVVSVAGVIISVLSFNATRDKESEARQAEAARPFLELRQKLYLETVKTAGVLSNPEVHTADEMAAAKKRFRQLYVAELSMVEAFNVEAQMVVFAQKIDPDLQKLTDAQRSALALSHALRDSFADAWGVKR